MSKVQSLSVATRVSACGPQSEMSHTTTTTTITIIIIIIIITTDNDQR